MYICLAPFYREFAGVPSWRLRNRKSQQGTYNNKKQPIATNKQNTHTHTQIHTTHKPTAATAATTAATTTTTLEYNSTRVQEY